MKSVAIFCGSSKGHLPIYGKVAQQLGYELAERKIEVVYGAGNVGIMGIVADATLEKGGRILGVIPQFLKEWEVCHEGLTELIVTETMHERKAIMAERSDGFIILPGGFGTLDEFFEILTWGQLHLHEKPIGVLNVGGFYDHILAHAQHLFERGFVRENNLKLFCVADNIEELLSKMERFKTTKEGKWVEK